MGLRQLSSCSLVQDHPARFIGAGCAGGMGAGGKTLAGLSLAPSTVSLFLLQMKKSRPKETANVSRPQTPALVLSSSQIRECFCETPTFSSSHCHYFLAFKEGALLQVFPSQELMQGMDS